MNVDPVWFVITGLGLVLVGVLGLLVTLMFRIRREVHDLKAHDPAAGLLMLQNQLEALREHVRNTLEGGRMEINQRLEETHRVVGQVRQGLGEVDRQVRSVSDIAKDLRGLQDLLRSPKVRGGIGEFLLGDLLAQVLPADHYELQAAFPGGQRVDAVLKVGPRQVPVDAKFPLESYRRMVQAESDTARRQSRRQLIQDLKRHVDAIATRYIRPGEGTYDFALMYIPAEAVYQEIIRRDDDTEPDLLDYALSRRVIPVSPQSFYAYLQVILLGLRGLTIEERAREIMERLGLIRTRLDRFSESFELAGKHLANAQRQMDEAGRRLARLDAALSELGDVGAEASAASGSPPVTTES